MNRSRRTGTLRGRRSLVVALVSLGVAGCGATKYRIAPESFADDIGRDVPCGVRVDDAARQPGDLTPFRCAPWTDRSDFDVIESVTAWFPHMYLARFGQNAASCDDCWVEVVRLGARKSPNGASHRISLFVDEPVGPVAVYEGGLAQARLDGEGTLTLRRVPRCVGYCLDYFVFDGLEATEVAIEGVWDGGFLADTEAVTVRASLTNGSTYDGRARLDRRRGYVPNGKGLRVEPSGAMYDGGWRDGVPHGEGEVLREDGATYRGTFSEGTPNGKGVYKWPDGDVHEGLFVAGVASGQGKRVFADGEVHEGLWARGEPDGPGEHRASSGVITRGVWSKGALDGSQVERLWPTGQRYKGTLVDDVPNGSGRFSWSDGTVYEGNFTAGRSDGNGEMIFSDGRRFIGRWERGRPSGLGRLERNDDEQLVGMWRSGRPDGCMLQIDAGGATWAGEFAHGAIVQTGCAAYPSSWPSEAFEALGEVPFKRNALGVAHSAQQRSRTARRDAEERLDAIRPRWATLLPVQPSADSSALAVRVGFAWPANKSQRLVAPRCVADGSLTATLDGKPAAVSVGGVIEAELAIWLQPSSTTKLCVAIDGACGAWQGCTTVDVPESAEAVADKGPSRLLLEAATAKDAATPPSDQPGDSSTPNALPGDGSAPPDDDSSPDGASRPDGRAGDAMDDRASPDE